MWKKRRGFFDNAFRELEDIEDMFNMLLDTIRGGKGLEGPLYYGFSVRVGTSGEPEIRTFGNIAPHVFGELESDVIEPFTDVIVDEKKKEVIVTAELPGCSERDVKIDATENSIEISAKSNDREYHKKVPLEAQIDPKSAKITCTNGICEIKLKLKRAIKSKGVNIKVE